MILKNTTKNSDRFLRRMIAWCCRELRMPVKFVRKASFGNRTGDRWRGTAWMRHFTVRIGDKVSYPTSSKYTQYKGAVKFENNDYFELLVNITAHELAHIRVNYRRTAGRKGPQRPTTVGTQTEGRPEQGPEIPGTGTVLRKTANGRRQEFPGRR